MTLVIATKADGKIRIQTDTKMSFPEDYYPDEDDPNSIENKLGLKIRIADSRRFAIAFAGDPSFFAPAALEMNKETCVTKLKQTILEHHQASANEQEVYATDFILGCAEPVKLFRFKAGGCIEMASLTHIGNTEAFNDILDKQNDIAYHNSTKSLSDRLKEKYDIDYQNSATKFGKIYDQFNELINTSQCKGVGGILLKVETYEGSFCFSQYSSVACSGENSFSEMISVRPINDGQSCRICFAESKRCIEYEPTPDGHLIPISKDWGPEDNQYI